MEYFINMIAGQPVAVILGVWLFLKTAKEVLEQFDWWKGRARDHYEQTKAKESEKAKIEQQVYDIVCTSQQHTQALERLGEVLEKMNTDLKGIQGNIDYLKDAHNETLSYMKDQEYKDSVRDRMNLGMARSMLITNYERCVTKGTYTTEEKEVYHELYKAYEEAGGNGIIKDIRDRILQLPDH